MSEKPKARLDPDYARSIELELAERLEIDPDRIFVDFQPYMGSDVSVSVDKKRTKALGVECYRVLIYSPARMDSRIRGAKDGAVQIIQEHWAEERGEFVELKWTWRQVQNKTREDGKKPFVVARPTIQVPVSILHILKDEKGNIRQQTIDPLTINPKWYAGVNGMGFQNFINRVREQIEVDGFKVPHKDEDLWNEFCSLAYMWMLGQIGVPSYPYPVYAPKAVSERYFKEREARKQQWQQEQEQPSSTD